MRITGGEYRGRKIICPPGVIRPAMDRMRESFFSILGDISSKSFLDLYSGSGIIGIEAASRGASPVFLVEKDPGKRAVLYKNISFVTEEIKVVIMPVERFIRMQKIGFDYIFLDPPFNQKAKLEVIESIANLSLLALDGVLVIHHPKEEIFPNTIASLSLTDRRTYGGSILCFYEQPPQASSSV
jgi:16S rRNA (guanine966-N2)-methyltransferase